MPRLRALRFESIGHRDARLGGLTLRFTDGEEQPCDSVIWLRNGGGKSSILNLLFSLLRPHQREFLGAEAEARVRELSDYVAPDDVASVCLEWQLDGGEERLLTGMCMEYLRAGEGARLERVWYAVRIEQPDTQSVSIDSLPLFASSDGKRTLRRLRDVREAILALDGHPGIRVSLTRTQSEWAQLLDSLHLDPELFGYQVKMNRREGAADELFRFASSGEFADFLLDMVLPADDAEQVNANLRAFRAQVERRPVLDAEREALERATSTLTPIVQLAVERVANRRALVAAAAALRELRGAARSLHGRRALETERAGVEARAQLERQRRAGEARLRAQRDSVALRASRARLEERAETERHRRAEGEVRRLRREVKLIQLAPPLAALREGEERLAALRRLLDERLTVSRPLLDELRRAAWSLRGALDGALADLETRRQLVAQQLARSDAERAQRERDRDAARDAQSRGSERIAQVERRLNELADRRAAMVAAGFLTEGESVGASLARQRALVEEVTRQSEEQRLLRARLLDEARAAEGRCQELAVRAAEVRAEARAARERLANAERERAALQGERVLRETLEDPEPDLIRLAADAVARLSARSEALARELLALGIEERIEERVLRSLEQRELLPPSLDVEKVERALKAGGVAAFDGGRYLAENARGDRAAELIRAHPELAGGVVVPADSIERAEALLAGEELGLGAPVAVGTTVELLADGRAGRVVLPARALYDRGAAVGERERRREARSRRAARTTLLEELRRDLDQVRLRVETFQRAHPSSWFAAARERLATLAGSEASCAAEEAEQRALERRTRQDVARIEEEEGTRRGRLRAAERAVSTLEEFRASGGDGVAAQLEELDRLRRDRLATEEEERRLSGELERGRAQRGQLESQDRLLFVDAAPLSTERTEAASHCDPDHEGPPLSLVEARERYRARRDAYEERSGGELRERLRAEEAAGRSAIERFERELRARELRRGDVEEALERARDTGLEIAGQRLGEQLDRAVDEHADAKRSLRDAHARVAELDGELTELRHKGHAETLAEVLAGAATLDAAALDGAIAGAEAAIAQARTDEREAEAAANDAGERRRIGEAELALLAQLIDRQGDAARQLRVCDEAARLLDAPDPDPAAEASLASVDERTALMVGRVRGEVDEESRLARRADEEARRLAAFAHRPEHAVLPQALRDRLAEPSVEILLARAADHLLDVKVRAEAVTAELAQVDQNRQIIATSLQRAADPAFRLLKNLEAASLFPASVPVWGSEPFIRVRLDLPPTAERDALAAGLVDRVVQSREVPSGLKLVQRLVHELTRGDGLSIRILKPEAHRRVHYEPIEKLRSFSRGEQLTAAILLYCTLARLRARERGRRGEGSVLVLDNPLGTCSQPALVELQRAMAAAHGVQLIYTTGIEDLEALSRLPNIVRLRNAHQDLRGQMHVTAEPSETRLGAARVVRTERR